MYEILRSEFGKFDSTCRKTKLCKLSSDDSSSDDNNDTNTSTTSSLQGLPNLLLPVSSDQSDDDSKQSESSLDLSYSFIHRHPIGLDKPDLNVQSDEDNLLNSIEDSSQEQSMEDDDKGFSDSPMRVEEDGAREHVGDLSSDLDTLIQPIGRDNSISCLLWCSSSDYGSIALLNWSFCSLIRSEKIYKLRRQNVVVEQWHQYDAPRCLFRTTRLGDIAILVGGCDSQGNILSSVEICYSKMQK
ncbi:hypothetical protein J1N35_026746 [Gossypium stocksii]|uniref:Uncharacterized protein n=1 Tax=Gossypium stocksii TaxID=47602 RepID=A0A9D3ZZI2_9ROSI|nr:hypothetical protein J1N35_026746 [Gossypium stocksii]